MQDFLYISNHGIPKHIEGFSNYEEFLEFINDLKIFQTAAIELEDIVEGKRIIMSMAMFNVVCDEANGRLRIPFTTNFFEGKLPVDDTTGKPMPLAMKVLSAIDNYINTIFDKNEVNITGEFIGSGPTSTAELFININNVVDGNGNPKENFNELISERLARIFYNSDLIYIYK